MYDVWYTMYLLKLMKMKIYAKDTLSGNVDSVLHYDRHAFVSVYILHYIIL